MESIQQGLSVKIAPSVAGRSGCFTCGQCHEYIATVATRWLSQSEPLRRWLHNKDSWRRGQISVADARSGVRMVINAGYSALTGAVALRKLHPVAIKEFVLPIQTGYRQPAEI